MDGGLRRCSLEGRWGGIRRGLREGNRCVIGGGCRILLLLARVLMLNLWGLMLIILTRLSVRGLGCIARAVILATRVLHSRDLNEGAGR
jgi:hypothetical protein